jgi:hypothetical protein
MELGLPWKYRQQEATATREGVLMFGLARAVETQHVAPTVDILSEEAYRIEVLIRSLDHTLADPHLELAKAIRLTISSKRLEAYLHGIHFALGKAEQFCPKQGHQNGEA